MTTAKPAGRRRNSAEETRRRVLDVVVQTVIDIGYYKASSNEIARRAGVTWGSIQHLFGSRDQLMLDVVNYAGARLEESIGKADIEGDTLEDRLESVLDVMAESYESDAFLVQMQILLELSAIGNKSGAVGEVMEHNGGNFDRLAQPLLKKAIGDAAGEEDLVFFVFMTFRNYLLSRALAHRIANLPEGALNKPMNRSRGGNRATQRNLLIQSVALTLRAQAHERSIAIA